MDSVLNFEYKGGGYFRKKGIPKGEKAEIIHGGEFIKIASSEVERLTEMVRGDCDYCAIQKDFDRCRECMFSGKGEKVLWQLKQEKDNG